MKKTIFIIITLLTTLFCNAQSYNYEQGVKAYDDGNQEKALDYFGRDIYDNPKAALSFYYRAIIYYYQDQNALALSDINNAIKYINSKDKDLLSGAHKLRGNIYLRIENFDKTFEDYAKAIKLYPEDPESYIERAQIYFELKEYSKAESDYKKALKIDESLALPYAGLGRNYIFQKNYTEAEKVLNKLIKLSPDYSGGYKYRAMLFFEQNKYEEAIEDIFYASLLDPTDSDMQSLFISYSNKNYPLSLSKVNAQISSNPEKEHWYFVRAEINEGNNDFKAAISDYTKLLTITDNDSKSYLLSFRAKCFFNIGMYEESISDYSDAISIDSTDAYYYGYRADAKRLMGNFNGAIEDFTKAIEIDPQGSWFYYRRGWIKDEFLNNNEAGLDDYNKAISINKKYPYTYLNRGRLYDFELKNSIKAKDDYTKILSLDTIILENGNCRQYALFHLGRTDEAITWITKIIEQYPNDGNYYDATCLYSLMNKKSEALTYLQLAFENGFRNFNQLEYDDDINNIRNLNEFKTLVAKWKNVFDETQKKDVIEKKEDIKSETQTATIPMKISGGGTYEVPCKINDLKLNLIFDTGASDITISKTEAEFMLKNNYLNKNDIIGSSSYMIANGDIEIGTTIVFRKVDFGGLILKNVKASVIENKNAPLLFGQSALSKYGKIIIDNENKIITITAK
jgi:clan AA aspartic protease (TIGR02281 family)